MYFKRVLHKIQYYMLHIIVQISSLPLAFNVGPLYMSTMPVKNFLEGMAVQRKTKYASLLHERARVRTKKSFDHAHVLYTHTSMHAHVHT